MRPLHSSLALAVLALAGLASAPAAQTTGVPGFNDLTIGGSISGSTSCSSISIPGGGPTLFQLSSVMPNMPVLLLFRLCPCNACFSTLPVSSCPIPFTACGVPGAVSNQSLDIDITCPGVNQFGVTGNLGVYSQVINLPPSLDFSVQGIVADLTGVTCVSAGSGWIVSQAYDVSTF